MLDPRTIDWSDIPSDSEYETQLENFKKKDHSLDTTKQYSENASTSEEGSIVTSPFLLSSSKLSFQSSSSNKTVKEKVEQIRNLHGSFVYLNVFDLTADITGADFIQFYDPLLITSIIKYPNSTMLDLEFSCKDDAIKAIEKGVGMIKGCLFSVRVSKRNYNPSVSFRQRRAEADRYTFYAKKDSAQSPLVTYTKKSNVQEPAEQEIQSLQTINEEIQKVPSIEISQSQSETQTETEAETCISEQAKTIESLMNSPQIDMVGVGKSVSLSMMNSPQPKKGMSKLATRTPPVKVGKYRNIVRSSGSKTQESYQPSAEEMEKVNRLQKTLIEQFLQEKEAAEKRIQRELEEKQERERLQKEIEEFARIQKEKEELERVQKEKEIEEQLEKERKAKEEEEEASKPVRKEVYEKVIYQRTNYRDDGYYRNNRYSYDSYRYPRAGAYKFATVEKEYTVKRNY